MKGNIIKINRLWCRLTKALHCLLYNSGFFRNGTGEMPLKYHVTRIQAPLATPFFCVILAFWIRVVDSREERETVSWIYVCTPGKRLVLELLPPCWVLPQTTQESPLCSLSSTGETHLPFQLYPFIKHFSFPEKASPWSHVFSGEFSVHRQTVRPC